MNSEIDEYIEQLVEEIKNKNFIGTEEEIAIQQILYLDKYIKENIDYGFEAIQYLIEHPNLPNPFSDMFTEKGFFEENDYTNKRSAVCGSISRVAYKVLNKLGIETDFVWGHVGNIGHRWNIITIGNKKYMIDFTINLVKFKCNQEEYVNAANMLGINDRDNEFLFFDKLIDNETIGGFKIGSNGHEDNIDLNGNFIDITSNPYELYPNLSILSQEQIMFYRQNMETRIYK